MRRGFQNVANFAPAQTIAFPAFPHRSLIAREIPAATPEVHAFRF